MMKKIVKKQELANVLDNALKNAVDMTIRRLGEISPEAAEITEFLEGIDFQHYTHPEIFPDFQEHVKEYAAGFPIGGLVCDFEMTDQEEILESVFALADDYTIPEPRLTIAKAIFWGFWAAELLRIDYNTELTE